MRSTTLFPLALGLAAACAMRPPALEPPSAAPSTAGGGPGGAAQDSVTVCAIQGGQVRLATVPVDPATGDTMLAGQGFDVVFPVIPGPYATDQEWFVGRRPILFQERAYTWNGPTLVLSPDMLKRVGEYRGVPLYTEAESTGEPGIVMVALRPGCELQPYYHFTGGPVRGG